MVLKTLEIVDYFQPDLWWLENTRTGILPKRSCVQGLSYVDLDYCQFSDWGYQKPTRFWGSENLHLLQDRICDGISCPNLVPGQNGPRKHKERLGGPNMRVSTHLKWRVPEKLVLYLLSVLDHQEEKFSFKREDYAVRNDFVKIIEEKFQKKLTVIVLHHPKIPYAQHFSLKMKMLCKRNGGGERHYG